MKKIVISCVIVLSVLLHGIPVLQELRGHRQTTWPIMAWGMYRNTFKPPIEADIQHLLGVTASGREIQLKAWDTGLNSFGFRRLFVFPMAEGDAASAQRLADHLNPGRHDPFVRFDLKTKRFRITERGVIQQDLDQVTYLVR